MLPLYNVSWDALDYTVATWRKIKAASQRSNVCLISAIVSRFYTPGCNGRGLGGRSLVPAGITENSGRPSTASPWAPCVGRSINPIYFRHCGQISVIGSRSPI